ncbi:SIS domain-containing protein [Oceanobacillus neutriphilus]|uniref:Tagatose-6-phosphate ketose isomerase n=1 Tax=Oceanobacillus neutriphilus TaxID=531815 RepID=A0ABQ2NNQ3_9BACI|nr:SIS domain-containing protein [Oceanobacillus neutriphilus]GGP07463.1 tagatose-6-phosphate ketose isomerase [Oceanobacillus neutriphilus]
MFHLTEQELKDGYGGYTAKEINQQPKVWLEAFTNFEENRTQYQGFIQSILKKHTQVKVLLAGAGTSAFAGDVMAHVLQRQYQGTAQFEAAATTDIVSNPENYLFKEVPTILVSFARSGNSPESVAAVELGGQIVKDFYQVVITCNKDGELAKRTENDANSLSILTPDDAHDQGFAMTSSYTSMMLLCYELFSLTPVSKQQLELLAKCAENILGTVTPAVEEILEIPMDRIVYLGSGLLQHVAHEASLKMLELTGGQVAAVYESSLGFRHGPKSILNDQSAAVVFLSENPYTREYDLDIVKELAAEDSQLKLIVIGERYDKTVEELADWSLFVNHTESVIQNDFYNSLLYIIFPQVLALKKSAQLGITPDNPSPSGSVNRVVQGVTIYDYSGEEEK